MFLSRVANKDNTKIGSYVFPKDEMILVSSWHEQRDREVWNEGPVDGIFHSVDDFWAERFLVDPKDSSTGPRKLGLTSGSSEKEKAQIAKEEASPVKEEKSKGEEKKYFTTEPVTGSFVPYGGGLKICKGRFYAKQEAMGSLALFLNMFEIEVGKIEEAKDGKPVPNMTYFPFGVLPPKGKVGLRMRRRGLE